MSKTAARTTAAACKTRWRSGQTTSLSWDQASARKLGQDGLAGLAGRRGTDGGGGSSSVVGGAGGRGGRGGTRADAGSGSTAQVSRS